MKVDGTLSTFSYSSAYWSNQSPYGRSAHSIIIVLTAVIVCALCLYCIYGSCCMCLIYDALCYYYTYCGFCMCPIYDVLLWVNYMWSEFFIWEVHQIRLFLFRFIRYEHNIASLSYGSGIDFSGEFKSPLYWQMNFTQLLLGMSSPKGNTISWNTYTYTGYLLQIKNKTLN